MDMYNLPVFSKIKLLVPGSNADCHSSTAVNSRLCELRIDYLIEDG